jgi:hypothetical protein
LQAKFTEEIIERKRIKRKRMTVSLEVGIGITINLITLGVTIGVFVSKINLVLFRIEQLERKQDKYNKL